MWVWEDVALTATKGHNFIFVSDSKSPSSSWLLWQGQMSLATLSDLQELWPRFQSPRPPIRARSCRVTGWVFVTLILCHSGCSPLWFCFSPISCCSPVLPFHHLIFLSLLCLYFVRVSFHPILHLSPCKASLVHARLWEGKWTITCVCHKSVLPGRDRGRFVFLSGAQSLPLILFMPPPSSYFLSSFLSSVSCCFPPFTQRSRFLPSGLNSCQRCGGFFSNPQSARAQCRKSTLVPSIIYEICCTLLS